MTPAQQAAKEYAKDSGAIMPYREASETYKVRYSSFLAGAAYAEGEFAEWLMDNNWHYWSNGNWITNDDGMRTTTELYQLWQQSL